MADVKFITDSVYKHRAEFFATNGQRLVEESIIALSKIYNTVYESSLAINNDFPDKNLFEYIERSFNSILKYNFKIEDNHGLITGFNEVDVYPFYPTGIPVKIRELIKDDLLIFEEYYKECIYSHMKRFFIRGRVSLDFLKIDLVYKHGFNKFLTSIKRYDLKQIDEDLNNFTEEGIYGLLDNADLYARYTNLASKDIKVQLLKFNDGIDRWSLQPPLSFNSTIYDIKLNPIEYVMDNSFLDEYIESFNLPNNIVRELLGLPKIGEGWISETKLYYQLKAHFNHHVLLQHQKPKWLGRQHFDIYFPYLNIAIEYQGKQHYEAVDFFGGIDSFEKNIERDNRKKGLAIKNNCDLIYVDEGYDLNEVIENIFNCNNYK